MPKKGDREKGGVEVEVLVYEQQVQPNRQTDEQTNRRTDEQADRRTRAYR
jgi:hypothetical protein